MACPGLLAVYQTFPGPLATQQGAFAGKEGVGPATGWTLRCASTIAKLSGLCAGVNPRISPQKASPSGVLFAVLGSAIGAAPPLSAPVRVRPTCRRDPDVIVTAPQVLPTAICAAEGSARWTAAPSRAPDGHVWLSTHAAPATKSSPPARASESGLRQPGASGTCRLT